MSKKWGINMENLNETKDINSIVEKIDLVELKIEQAKIKFEENADQIINDPNNALKGLKYLQQHKEEYKDIYGIDLKIE